MLISNPVVSRVHFCCISFSLCESDLLFSTKDRESNYCFTKLQNEHRRKESREKATQRIKTTTVTRNFEVSDDCCV